MATHTTRRRLVPVDLPAWMIVFRTDMRDACVHFKHGYMRDVRDAESFVPCLLFAWHDAPSCQVDIQYAESWSSDNVEHQTSNQLGCSRKEVNHLRSMAPKFAPVGATLTPPSIPLTPALAYKERGSYATGRGSYACFRMPDMALTPPTVALTPAFACRTRLLRYRWWLLRLLLHT